MSYKCRVPSILPLVSQSNQRCGKLRGISPDFEKSAARRAFHRHSLCSPRVTAVRWQAPRSGWSDFKSFIKPSTHFSNSFPLSSSHRSPAKSDSFFKLSNPTSADAFRHITNIVHDLFVLPLLSWTRKKRLPTFAPTPRTIVSCTCSCNCQRTKRR